MPVHHFITPTLCLVAAIALLGCQSASQTTEAAQCTTTVTESADDAPASDAETKPGAVIDARRWWRRDDRGRRRWFHHRCCAHIDDTARPWDL